MSYVRSLPQEMMLRPGRSKGLLKVHLDHWPSSFVDRPKMGFGYNLRWAWAVQGLGGLRRLVDEGAVARFEAYLPTTLRGAPSAWRRRDLFRHFDLVTRLAAWSAWRRRVTDLGPR